MSLTRARLPALSRGISTTAARFKKIGAPDKQDRDRIRADQEKQNKERAQAARAARLRGDDWADTGFRPVTGRVFLDRKRRRAKLFDEPIPEAKTAFKGQGALPAFHRLPKFGTEEHAVVGSSSLFPMGLKDPIPIFGVPRNLEQDFQLLSKPASVIRQCSLDMRTTLRELAEPDTPSAHRIIMGPPGSGKSYTLLQAVHYAVQMDWVVVYIPRGLNLVKNMSEYVYDRRSRTFFQPEDSKRILQQMVDVNTTMRRVLSPNAARLLDSALNDPADAPEALRAVLTSLGQQKEMPVLIAVDEMQALYSTSWYKDPYFKPIEACHLSVPRLLLEFASGRRELQRGAFLGTYTSTNTHFPLPLVLREAAGAPYEEPAGPYSSRPEHLLAYISDDLTGWPLTRGGMLTSREATAMYDLWHLARAVPGSYTERTFMNAWATSSGNARALVKDGMLYAMEV